MLLHKIEVYVFDHELVGGEEAAQMVREIRTRVPVYFTAKKVETIEIKDWSDDHELNKTGTPIERFRERFT